MQPETSHTTLLTLATNEMKRIVHTKPFAGKIRENHPHDERHEQEDDDDDDDTNSDDEHKKSEPHK